MELVGQRVDDRDRADRRHLLDALLAVGPPHDRGDLAGQHAGGVGDRLADADAGQPAVDHDRVTAELGDTDRERQLRAQGLLVEDQGDGLRPGQRAVPVPVGLHRVGEIEHLEQLVRGEVVVAQEVPRHRRPRPARRRAAATASSTSASVRISGGASRRASGLTALTSSPRRRAAASTRRRVRGREADGPPQAAAADLGDQRAVERARAGRRGARRPA